MTDLANARELADNRAFLTEVVDRYYAVACGAVRRHAPRHLIFGDKLDANTEGGDAVLTVLDGWRRLADKPFFNGDGSFSSPDAMMPNPHGPHSRDQAERGELAFEFGRHAFARPDFAGGSVCGRVDTWKTRPKKELKPHSGFFSPQGEPHEPYIRRLRELSERLDGFARG